MEHHGNHRGAEYFAENKMGGANTRHCRIRLFDLVLVRKIGLAKFETKLVFCCYIKSSADSFHPIYYKIIVERGL